MLVRTKNGRGVLEQPVRHLVQRQPDILEAQLLAGDVERHMGKTAMHQTHDPRQHGSVAHPGVEHP